MYLELRRWSDPSIHLEINSLMVVCMNCMHRCTQAVYLSDIKHSGISLDVAMPHDAILYTHTHTHTQSSSVKSQSTAALLLRFSSVCSRRNPDRADPFSLKCLFTLVAPFSYRHLLNLHLLHGRCVFNGQCVNMSHCTINVDEVVYCKKKKWLSNISTCWFLENVRFWQKLKKLNWFLDLNPCKFYTER